ncbi:uncharacterized protein LOC134740660 isoform X1 [Cydia strobilella]|uniref:uncharacterized protein LOC134740660 isoform X1 n=2 Tax=Cydia strobilella TaxID=1100964 RepID=UPI003007DA85
MYHNYEYQYAAIQNRENGGSKMHGSCRVVTFCLLTTVLPTILIIIPLYLRNMRYADVMYKISDSDVIQIHKGQSSVFCKTHSLKMNTTFNAFQMTGKPALSIENKKHIRLKKSLTLPDDTLEYWGFYLFKGASVELEACSRYEGSKILVVKGDNILNTCGILEGNKYKKDAPHIDNQEHVIVTLANPGEKKEHPEDSVSIKNNLEQSNQGEENKVIKNINKTDSVQSNLEHNNVTMLNSLRFKRNTKPVHQPKTVLDAGIHHGGNAFNSTDGHQDKSVSSFEMSLHECYDNNIIINRELPYQAVCNSTKYFGKATTLKVTHDILLDGYYYYIFYSDNDFVKNNIHVIFDIYKPTFLYTNMSESKVCINKTECIFDIEFFSDELVIVEVPTKDGLSYDDNASILTSVCHPRMSVYIFFPVTVLMLIILFAFL